ncbi:MAG: hypothetical protein CMJ23_10365 [Phycisphaerae bacterium]|nr:hypothetical protein [Phycisphaerae bacterium]
MTAVSPRRILDQADAALDPFRDVPDRQRRADGGRFVVESPRVVSRFLAAIRDQGTIGCAAEAILLDPTRAPELSKEAEALGVPLLLADHEIMTQASGYHFHGGALAIGARPRRPASIDDLLLALPPRANRRALIVALAGITSMDNMGGIFRTAAALGADGLVLDHACADPLLRRCLRISMGQVFRVPWAVGGLMTEVLPELHDRGGFTSIGLENLPDADSFGGRSTGTSPTPARVVIVIGNEGHGLDADTLDACDELRRIDGPPDLPASERPGGDDERSLNAATAAAIAMHAILHG